jgi:hypothetical protein
VIIELRSGPSAAALLAYAPDVAEFIGRTLAVVPVDAEIEHYDIDAELTQLPVHDPHDV